MNKYWFMLFALLVLFSCSKDDADGVFAPANYIVKGKVEKGPFVKGSIVTLQPLNGKLSPLGTSFTGNIIDNEGNFDFGTLKLDAPYALLTTDGYFFNEVEGDLSQGKITLQAIVNLADNSTVNVNLLTHLSKERIKKLVADGASFSDANKQAQKELLTNFGFQKYADTDVSHFSITSGTNEAAALIMVSSALLHNRSEAELTEAIAEVSAEFTAEGILSEAVKKEYRSIAMKLPYQMIVDNIVGRYQSMGKEVMVKDLSRYVDWDNDGVAGNEFNESGEPLELEFETKKLDLPTKGGTVTVKIKANAPYSLTHPFGDDVIVGGGSGHFYNQIPISYEKNLDQNVLTIKVDPASGFVMKDETINLYSMDGKVHSTLILTQAGDPLKASALLSENGRLRLQEITRYMTAALSQLHMMEALYTKSYQKTNTAWDIFSSLYVAPSDASLERAWASDYNALQRIKGTAAIADPDLPTMAPYFTCMESALYFEMAVMWENAVFVKKPFSLSLPLDQLFEQCSSKELFSQLEDKLIQGTERFFAKKNTFNDVDNFFLISRDVPRALLAKMYLYQKEYDKAYVLLDEICRDKHYQLEASRSVAMSKNSREMIYGLPLSDKNGELPFNTYLESEDYFIPIVTYTEVLLSMAECAYQLNNKIVADDCLDQVLATRGIIASKDFMTSLHKAWTSELKGTGTYFAFLKRNELALKQLNISNKNYLILPIPSRELMVNNFLRQNSGY